MTRVRAFFVREAAECLAAARAELEATPVDTAAVHRAVRHFRGSAQMARFGGLADTAAGLERRLRSSRDAGANEGLVREIRAVVTSLETELDAVRAGRLEEDPRMEAGMDEQEGEHVSAAPEIVSVETLEYGTDAALTRALELRPALESALDPDDAGSRILDELFDLIRLGAK